MSTMATYKTLDGGTVQEVFPDPAPAAGYSLNTNFRAIADSLPRNNYGASTNPTVNNDSVDTAGIGVKFAKGSRWYNGTAIFECVDPTPAAAVWVAVIENISGNVSLRGANLNLNNGAGSGGGNLNLDSGNIQLTNSDGLYFAISTDGDGGLTIGTGGEASLNISKYGVYNIGDGSLQMDNFGSINLGGGVINMNDGSGSGGGTLFMDGGAIQLGSGGRIADDGSGGIRLWGSSAPDPLHIGAGGDTYFRSNAVNMAEGAGNEGGPLNLDGGTVYGSANGSGQAGGTWYLGDGTGANGGTLQLDGGTIVQMRADNQPSAPSSPNPGQIYFDTTTNHLYVWNGTAWKQLDN